MCVGTCGPTMKSLLTATPSPWPAGASGSWDGEVGGCALTSGWGEMVQITTIRFQCGVVRMAETNASEGALEVGKFLCKGQKGRAPPFEEDVSSQGILLSGEAVHKGSIIEDCNGDLESRNDSRNFSSVVNSIAHDCEEGEFPFIQSLSGFLGAHANAGSKCEGEQMFVHCRKCGCYKHRVEIVHYIVEDRQKASALETKFQAKVFRLRDEVGLREPRKKHPSGLIFLPCLQPLLFVLNLVLLSFSKTNHG